MRAYVLVDCSLDKARELVNSLRDHENVLAADLINGPHSAVFVVQANESQEIAKTVLFNIGRQGYLRNVTVYLALDEKKYGSRELLHQKVRLK